MNLTKLLTSPLAATAGVLAGLAMLAIPLRHLTSAPPVPPVKPPAAGIEGMVPAWLSLKLLAPAKSVTVKTTAGQVLWSLGETPAGDAETQAGLPLAGGRQDLMLTADFGGNPSDTAVFLTIAPDGMEEQTRHAIGSGLIEESLWFSWPGH